MNNKLETCAIGTFARIRDAIEIGKYEKAVQLCTDGIALIRSLSATLETNSALDNEVSIF